MPQKNAFIIDEDREFAKRVAAALRTDLLKVVIAEDDRDPLDALGAERPDIILMRADAREGESGFALCSRIKQQGRLTNVPVFLYSAEVDDQTFDHHRTQQWAADAYMHFPAEPPYPMDDLKSKVDAALAAQADEVEEGEDEPGPPPLPDPPEPAKPITEEDSAFLDRVLDSLQQGGVDEDASSAIPPLRPSSVASRRTTADAKLDMLRQKLRQREFELAKVMEMYRAKEREYHEWNERLVEKDVEAQALKVTIEDLQRTAEMAQGELDRRTSEFNSSFEQLLEEKVSRENELIHTVAVKEKELADVHSRLLRAQRDAEKVKGDLNAAFASAAQTAESHRETLQELQGQLEEREGTLASLEQALADTQEQVAELERSGESRDEDIRGQRAQSVELQALILSLRDDLADAREAHDDVVVRHQYELRSYDEIVDGLRSDLDEAEASFAQLETDLKGEVAELTVELQSRQERLRAAQVAQGDVELAYRQLWRQGAAKEVELGGRITQLKDALDAERIDRADAEAQLDDEVQQARQKVASLEEQIADLEVVSGERIRVLTAQVDERDAHLTQMRQVMEEERARFDQAEETLKEAVAELESRRQQLQSEVDSRLADLAETEANHAEAIATRDAIQSRLEAELQQSSDDVASLNAEIAEIQNHLEELEQTKVDLDAALRERGDQVSTLSTHLENERRERDEAERIIATLQLDLEGARGELLNTQQIVRDKDTGLQDFRETLAVRDGRIVELQNEQTTRQAQLEQLRVELDARYERVGRLEGQLSNHEDTIENLKAEADLRDVQLREANESLSELRANLAASQSSATERSARLDEARAEWMALREELVAERHQLNGRLDAMQQDLDDTRSMRDSLATEKIKLEEQRDMLLKTEDDLRLDIEARRTHAESIDRELEAERATLRASEETVARLREELANHTQTAKMASETAGVHHRELEQQVRTLTEERTTAVAETEQVRRSMSAELEQAEARIEALSAQVAALSAARDGLGDEATHLSKQLDEAVARSSSLATEKASLEQQRSDQVRELEQQLRAQEQAVADQKAEFERMRREREEVENKYVRELEELHDEYMQKAQETDAGHAREVENLRKAALDAKRQLKTAQLAAQRLEDRLRRVETERPARKDASADFESFIAQFSDSGGAGRMSPGRSARSPGQAAGRPSPAGLPAAANASRPPVRPSSAAEALASSAVMPNADKDEEVTDVGGQILSPPKSSRRPVSKDLSPPKRGEPDDFLAAFDKEFEDIKGG